MLKIIGAMKSYSQTNVDQLVQFRTAAFIQVSAAGVALLHQVSQERYGVSGLRITHTLETQDP